MRTIISALSAGVALVALAGSADAQPGSAGNANGAGPGSCGQYRFWHDGKCDDARERPSSKPWSDDMLAKKWAS